MKILYTTVISLLLLLTGYPVFGDDDYIMHDLRVFIGEWTTQCSNCTLIISSLDNASSFEIKLVDRSEFRRTITIEDIRWDGNILSFTSICEETGFTSHHKLTIENKCSLNDNITGSIEAKALWSRIQCQIQKNS